MKMLNWHAIWPLQVGLFYSCVIIHSFIILRNVVTIIGDYDSARIYYEGLIQSLHRLVIGISDPLRKGKWTMVSCNVMGRMLSSSFSFETMLLLYLFVCNHRYQKSDSLGSESYEMLLHVQIYQ